MIAPAVHNVGVGTYAMYYETTGNTLTCMGGDCMRNSIGVSGGSAFGSYSSGDYFGQLSSFFGANAMIGNSASITISGTITTGDVIQLTFTSSAIASGSSTVSYTVGAGNTLTQIANGIATAMTANAALVNADARSQYDANATPNTISVAYPGTSVIGSAPIVVTNTSTGITETVTITNGVTAATTRNSGFGYDAMQGGRWVSASYNNGMGAYVLANLTTGNQNNCFGDQACMFGTSINFLAAFGDQAFKNITTGFSNTGFGWEVGVNCTSCRNVTLLGKGAGTSTLTTGNDIIILSDGSTCDSNGPNVMLVCGGGGTFFNVTGTNTVATSVATMAGSLGVAGATSNATFTIGDAAGSATYGSHLGFLQTTKPVITGGTLDTTGSDAAGTITMTGANFTVTFNKVFATIPHCVVSSPSGTAAGTYSATTTALTFTGGASTNVFNYVCLQ